MLRKFDYYKKWLGKSVWFLVFLLCVGMVESKLNRQQCDNLLVKVDHESGMHFIDQTEIERILTDNGNDPVHGNRQKDIQLRKFEERVKANKLIRDCQVYHDLDGNLVVNIQQQKPVARWVGTSSHGEWRGANGFYINEEGMFMPLTNHFTARVLLVTGAYFQNIKGLTSTQEKSVLALIKYLREDAFWSAQVIQMNVAASGNIDLRTALGNQRIEFGKAQNVAEKLVKLRIFYDKVLSSDWNRYSKIDLRYHDQVVCE